VDGETVQLQIWDTAGHSDYRSLSSSYYRGAHGVLVVYDVSKFASFQNLQVWLEEIDMHASANVCCMLVGNKSEGTEKGARVDIKMAEEFARNIGSYGARSLARSFRPMTFSAKQDFICVSADDSNLGEINENGFDANFPHMQVRVCVCVCVCSGVV
jgi:GTPase SAR1 family protein